MKKTLCFFTIILTLMVSFVACSEMDGILDGSENPSQRDTIIGGDTIVINDTLVIKTPVWVDITGKGDTIMRDGEGDTIWLRPDWFFATLTCQDTVKVSSDTPWTLNESEVNPKTPSYDWGGGVTSWGYNHRVLSVTDSIYGIFRGRKLPLWKPERLHLEQMEYEPTMTDSTSVLNVEYVLSIGNILLAHRPQVLCTTTGNVPDVPEFQAMLWKAWHVGPATAIYADGQAIVTCPDSLVAYEVWDDGTTRNMLKALTHSKNIFAVACTGTEVEDIDAMIGKKLAVNGNKAYYADFSVTVSMISRTIAEKTLNYAYQGNVINFVDSLTACSYILLGGEIISESQVRVDMAHENTGEIVSIIIPVAFIEKRRIVAIDTTFIHINYISPASYSNGIITVSANHNAEFTLHYNDGGIEMENVAYKQHINWRVSYDTEMTVEDLSSVLGRHAVVDGKVTIQGYDFIFSFVNVICELFNGKAPKCSANIVAITIETNKLVVEIQGDHDSDNSTIYVELPLNVTEIIIIPGRILSGNRADAYEGQTTGRVTWDFIKSLNLSSGKYTVHSKKEEEISFNNHEEFSSFGNMTDSDPFSYWYDQAGEKHLGTYEAVKMDKSKEAFLIFYKNFYKETMYTLGTAEDAINNPYRNPNQGVLQKVVKGGKTLWTFDYKIYYRGSED